jgi:NAD kinase
MPPCEKIIIVTKRTALEELVERFNTREQARFYIEHMGASFAEYEAAHETYCRALASLKAALPRGARSQTIERAFLPTFQFGERDLVVTLGPDGLVVNTAKYLDGQPLLALNPDFRRVDGVLVPFPVEQAAALLPRVARGEYAVKRISMAKAELNDGQSLYAVNDLFIGQRTHVSARYRLSLQGRTEDQSSSGIIVSTGAGSTGWFRSILTGAAMVMAHFSSTEETRSAREQYRFAWDADFLYYTVREPFVSKLSSADLVFGRIEAGTDLEIESRMTHDGVIFSDGIEQDYLSFNTGAVARIRLSEKKLHLVCDGSHTSTVTSATSSSSGAIYSAGVNPKPFS